MVIEELMTRQIHLGNGENGFDGEVYLSIRRSIRELFSRFGEIVLALRETTEIKVRNPQKVINNVVEHYRLSEEQKGNIFMAFGAEPEADQYGIANAVARASQREESWEKAWSLRGWGASWLLSLRRSLRGGTSKGINRRFFKIAQK